MNDPGCFCVILENSTTRRKPMKKSCRKRERNILCVLLIFIFIFIFPMRVRAASPGYFENPSNVYHQFKSQIFYKQFKVKYAFLKESAPIYNDYQGSERIGKAPKYSGVMVVSQTKSYVQVIYEKKKGYGIGWMERKLYQEISCLYNGEEKQLIADGIYRLTNLKSEEDREIVLEFQGNQLYHIKSIDKERKTSVKSWRLIREYDHFYIKDEKSGNYLAADEQNHLTIVKIKERITNQFGPKKAKALLKCRWTLKRKHDKNVNPYRNFLQYDPAWARKDYGNVSDYSGKMAAAGCGVVAITNAVYALNGQFIDPMLLADYAVEKQYRIIGSGTDDGIFKAAAKKYGDAYGFYFIGTTHNTLKMRDYLKKGCVAISHVPGHYVTVADYNPKTEKYLVLDSHPLAKRLTSPFGNWFQWHRLESGGLTSSGYYIFSTEKGSGAYEKIKDIHFMGDLFYFMISMC